MHNILKHKDKGSRYGPVMHNDTESLSPRPQPDGLGRPHQRSSWETLGHFTYLQVECWGVVINIPPRSPLDKA